MIISFCLSNEKVPEYSLMPHLIIHRQSRALQDRFDTLKYLIHDRIYQKTLIDINDLAKHTLSVEPQRPIAQYLLLISSS